MAGQYQHRQFLRQVPNALLAQYFEQHDISLDVDLSKLKETDVEPLFVALTSLSQEKQASVEVDFQDIDALANPGGIEALCNEAEFFNKPDVINQIASIEGLHAKAMWTYLNAPEYWPGASAILHADTASSRSWRKRNDLPKVAPNVDDEAIGQLAEAISAYFNEREGRGRNCKVEPYRKVTAGKEYFFAYPEDYGQTDVEWEQHQLQVRPRHPAFEIIFAYCEKEGSLDVYAPRNMKAIPELQKIFARTILNLETLDDGSFDARVYDLDPLADPAFTFRYHEGSGICDVLVTQLRLALKAGSKRRIIVEANPKHDPEAVYKLLKAITPPDYFITQAKIQVVFDKPARGRAPTRTFTLTHPNFCNLNHDGKDQIIRQMLLDSGIEPHEPESGVSE